MNIYLLLMILDSGSLRQGEHTWLSSDYIPAVSFIIFFTCRFLIYLREYEHPGISILKRMYPILKGPLS